MEKRSDEKSINRFAIKNINFIYMKIDDTYSQTGVTKKKDSS